jgi:hypothetical protein
MSITSSGLPDMRTALERWLESSHAVADDFRALYFRIPPGAPLEIEIRDLVSRLEVANRNAVESIEELKHGRVVH